MSYQATCWAWNEATLTAGEKLVLLALADACGGDEDDPRVCWPSFERIARQCGISISMVKRHVTSLAERGKITKVERRIRADGTLGTWVYTINFTTDHPWSLEEASTDHGRSLVQGPPVTSLESVITEPEKEISRGFDDFWKGYPRKIAKPAAQKAWKKIALKDHLAVMLGLSLWAQYWKRVGTEHSFIPYPQKWLNERRWEDAPAPKTDPPVEYGSWGGPVKAGPS